jgi:hypothetical protein
MPKPYDDAMKKLVGGNPEDFLSWVLREAIYTQRLPYELHPESIYADGLIEAILDGKEYWHILNFRAATTSVLESDFWSIMYLRHVNTTM